METITKPTEKVRGYIKSEYIEPARKRHEVLVRVVAGEVQKALGLRQRIPLVCEALKSKKFLEENHLLLEKLEGPPSGQSTTVTFTYRLLDVPGGEQPASASPFFSLRGIAKDVFAELGGGEAYLRKEREEFQGPGQS
jgi:hypothetical protein